jgi:chromate transporter
VGLILSTAVQLGKRSLEHTADLVFVILTILGVNRLHLSVLTVLLVIGIIATFWYRPGMEQKQSVWP